jgi:hypothetical protein
VRCTAEIVKVKIVAKSKTEESQTASATRRRYRLMFRPEFDTARILRNCRRRSRNHLIARAGCVRGSQQRPVSIRTGVDKRNKGDRERNDELYDETRPGVVYGNSATQGLDDVVPMSLYNVVQAEHEQREPEAKADLSP